MLATEFCPGRVGGVYITGGSSGSADGPYLLSDGSPTNTCPIHTAPYVPPVLPPPEPPKAEMQTEEQKKENKEDKKENKPEKNEKNEDDG